MFTKVLDTIAQFVNEHSKGFLKVVHIFMTLVVVSCQSGYDEDSDATVFVRKTSSGYQLVRNNKPFFIKGTSGNSHFEELKKAGANTIRIYDTTNLKNTLDRANTTGLAVVLDVPVPRYEIPDTIYSNDGKMKRLFEHTKMFVNKYKGHPALLYWMLGNELKAPDLPGDDNFYGNFNKLVKMVKDIDKNHPVSTAIGGFDRSKVLSVHQKIPGLDLMSINVFGELSTFDSRKKLIAPLWNGPYVFSEFGVNGPWEAEQTLWNVPIEQTSTKKAEQYKTRYLEYIKTLDDGRFLGSLTFFWGYKQERTHTWFSFFSKDDKMTQQVFEMENLWKNQKRPFRGPQIDYILLNGQGASRNILLSGNEKASAKLLLPSVEDSLRYNIRWEIRPENWNYSHDDKESEPDPINNLIGSTRGNVMNFITPSEDGPYRLFVYVEDEMDFYATANIPFYVLNPQND